MKKPAQIPRLEIRLDARPLQRHLYQRLRETITLGRLPRGLRLPASRTVARGLGVSRNTVLFAYEELAADGVLSGRTGSGTRVARAARAMQLIDPDGIAFDCIEP